MVIPGWMEHDAEDRPTSALLETAWKYWVGDYLHFKLDTTGSYGK